MYFNFYNKEEIESVGRRGISKTSQNIGTMLSKRLPPTADRNKYRDSQPNNRQSLENLVEMGKGRLKEPESSRTTQEILQTN